MDLKGTRRKWLSSRRYGGPFGNSINNFSTQAYGDVGARNRRNLNNYSELFPWNPEVFLLPLLSLQNLMGQERCLFEEMVRKSFPLSSPP
jgi:hypothetical protein